MTPHNGMQRASGCESSLVRVVAVIVRRSRRRDRRSPIRPAARAAASIRRCGAFVGRKRADEPDRSGEPRSRTGRAAGVKRIPRSHACSAPSRHAARSEPVRPSSGRREDQIAALASDLAHVREARFRTSTRRHRPALIELTILDGSARAPPPRRAACAAAARRRYAPPPSRRARRNAARSTRRQPALAPPPIQIDELTAVTQHPVVVQRQHDRNAGSRQMLGRDRWTGRSGDGRGRCQAGSRRLTCAAARRTAGLR